MAFLGIRGIGSFYYLAYALNHGRFETWTACGRSPALWCWARS
ncbi:hypothetical protein [Caulobacter sp. B11]|nr:hypothetical protein [Caulobacter sp. B11]